MISLMKSRPVMQNTPTTSVQSDHNNDKLANTVRGSIN